MGDDVGASSGEQMEQDLVERADLSDTPEGRAIAAAFVADFGSFMTGTVRPVLRDVAADGGEPQLLVNGLAQLMREVASSIEFPVEAGPTPSSDPEPGE